MPSSLERLWTRLLEDEEENASDYVVNDLSRADLPPCERWDPGSYVEPPVGTRLSAKDWTARWLPLLKADVGPRWLQYANCVQMLGQVSEACNPADCMEMTQVKIASSWVSCLDAPGLYCRRDEGEPLSIH
jgi:hypothetical protein